MSLKECLELKVSSLTQPEPYYDVLVIGGGITGAGILLEAARLGLRAVLIEQQDFAWGTSSRSSKMVHGGLRYLAMGDIVLTLHSLQERERLLQALPDHVIRMPYVLPNFKGQSPSRLLLRLGLLAYDMLAGVLQHKAVGKKALLQQLPLLKKQGLKGAMQYPDALTDDSRLVMRVLHEASAYGATMLNYVRVDAVTPNAQGVQVQCTDQQTQQSFNVHATHVFNATGVWADRLSESPARIRPQRGSHYFFPLSKLPIKTCVTLVHPEDGRPVFVFPWRGVLCVGTTDVDHKDNLDIEAKTTDAELRYVLQAVHAHFDGLALKEEDLLATQAGVRPIVASGQGRNPSQESRAHAIWKNGRVVHVSGGKLTTFRQIALDALLAAKIIDEAKHRQSMKQAPKAFLVHSVGLPHYMGHPLYVPTSHEEWLTWFDYAIRCEMVVHVDDLLLRRTRIGLCEKDGGVLFKEDLCQLFIKHKAWTPAQFEAEWVRYETIRHQFYAMP